jgi:VCBS repeat-containing protein
MGAFNAQFSLNRGVFYNNTSEGYTFDFWHNSNSPQFSTITNSLVRNNNDSGAFNAMDGIIMNTTIVDNGSQMKFRGSSSIVNSIVTSGQFIYSSSGLLKIHNSHIEDGRNSVDVFPSFLTYQNNLDGDIYFNDAVNSDFTLSQYSSVIGAGINSITLYNVTYDLISNKDLNLNDRPLPQGTNIDIGAYENSLGTNSHNSSIYVSINDGNNEGSVGLETQPFNTIQAAINYALDGDAIYVLPGTYPGGASIINKGINFISTIPLGAIVNNSVNNSKAFTFSSNTGTFYSSITGFDINKTSTGQATGLNATDNHYVNIYKSRISNFTYATATGVSAIQAENCLFINNALTIYNDQCSTGSANIKPLLKNCTIINSGSVHNACSTISLEVINSIVLISDTNQNAYTSPPNFNKVITNDVNVVPQENSTWSIALDGEKDIYFTDFTNGDYSLQDFSPAIGYGFFPVSYDITGGARPLPVGSPLDIGAYENALGSPLNGSPRFDSIADVSVDEDSGTQSLDILNVLDGDILKTQNLSFSFATDNDGLFELIEINYTQGSGTAVLNYIPALDKNGTANITVTLNDDAGTDGGGVDSITKTFTITINPLNDQPIVLNHSMLVDEGATIVALSNNETNLLYNAVDVDQDILSAILVTEPSNGSLTLNSDRTFSYTHDSSETISDSFTYKANDGLLDSNIATVTITINPVNDAPVLSNHTLTVNEGGVATILDNSESSLLFNASDIEGDSFTAIVETEPNNGTLVLNTDGTFIYSHDSSDTLTDSFTYRADDSNLTSEIGTISITINPVNDNIPTDINLSNNSINENQDAANGFLIGQFTTTDSDLPSDSHTFELASGDGDTNNNNFIIDGNNLKTFTSFDFETQESLSIRVKTIDEVNQSFEKVFTINIINVNDISLESVVTNSYCEGNTSNGSITISNISNTTGNIEFSWTATNGGSVPIGQENNQNLTDLKDGTYTAIVSDATDFTLNEEFQITLIPQYSDLSVCYVTSDEEDPIKNRIFIYNEGNYNVSSYEVLRETNTANVYNVIGNIDSNMNSFLDNNSNNNSQEYRYKVRLVDLCGNKSPSSGLHKSILLQSSISIDNKVNLNWTKYEGTDVPSYKIYRKINNENYEVLDDISSNSTSYNDLTANTSLNNYEYYIAVQVNNCNTSTAKSSTKINLTEIKSNRQQIGDGSLSLNELIFENSISIFPNPATETININVKSDISYIKSEVYNLIGQRILETDKKSVSIENLSKSTYFLKIFTEKGIVIKKFVKN